MLQKKNEGILFSAEIRVVGSYSDRLLSLITCVHLNLAMITVNFEASLHWRTDEFDAVKKLNER